MEAGPFWILEHAMVVLQMIQTPSTETVYIMACSLCHTVVQSGSEALDYPKLIS